MNFAEKPDAFARTVELDLRETEHMLDAAGARLAEMITHALTGRIRGGSRPAPGRRSSAPRRAPCTP